MIRYVKRHRLNVPNLPFVVKNAPNMMHAYVGAHVVSENGWLSRKNDLRAIESHTLGRRKMTLEEKILYIADFAEPGRPYTAIAAAIRATALRDLEAGFREAIANKISYQLKKGKPVHPRALEVWNRVVCHVTD
jgi:predicted HD superfamily hydrolase involved in NAD metabolism